MTIVTRRDTLLPDPEPRPVRYTVISVDDHLVEPPDMFEGRLPARFADRAPRIVENARGHQLWEFDGKRYSQVGHERGRRAPARGGHPRAHPVRGHAAGVLGHRRPHRRHGPQRGVGLAQLPLPDHRVLRPGVLGVLATPSWVWPSPGPGTTGSTRRGGSPIRTGSSPCGITFLADPELGAAEVRRNAERGFRSVTLPERPHRIGLPSLFSGYWDPIIAACEETDTVISLHVGSSGMPDMPADSPAGGPRRHPVRPDVAVGLRRVALVGPARALSGHQDRHERGRHRLGGHAARPPRQHRGPLGLRAGLRPLGTPARPRCWPANFWFCTIDDPSTIDTRHRIGIDHIMVEVDYPHGDSTWPDTQSVIERCWGHLPVEDLRKLTHQNAAGLYRWPLPDRHRCREPRAVRPLARTPCCPSCRRARSWSCWPGPSGARGTTTTWPATSPTDSPTAPCSATRGSSCGRSSVPTTCWSSTSTATGWRVAGRSRSGSRSTSSSTASATTWWWPCTAIPGTARSGPTWAASRAATTRARPSGGGELVVVDEYDGPVDSRDSAARAVAAMGSADMALLANHGVFVTAGSIRAAHQRAVALEYRSRRAWQVEALGAGRELPDPARQLLPGLRRRGVPRVLRGHGPARAPPGPALPRAERGTDPSASRDGRAPGRAVAPGRGPGGV